MKKYYEKKRRYVDAVQWNKDGDHEKVEPFPPHLNVIKCDDCGRRLCDHGMLQHGARDLPSIVCPGDFIVKDGLSLEHWPKELFNANFAPAESQTSHWDYIYATYGWVTMDSCGYWFAYDSKPSIRGSEWFGGEHGRQKLLSGKQVPKYEGTWENSLQERP